MAPPGKKRGAAPDTKRTKKRVPDPSGAGKRLRVDPSTTVEQVLRSKKSANLVFDLLELLEVRPAPEAETTWQRPPSFRVPVLLRFGSFGGGRVPPHCGARNRFVEATWGI